MIEKSDLVYKLGPGLSSKKIARRLHKSEKTILYWVRRCGLSTVFSWYGHTRTKSLKEMADAMVQQPSVHRRRLKARAIAYKGGRCTLCGYSRCNAALEFHHLDKPTKGFGLSQGGVIRSWGSIRTELNKCVLICTNCHREVEAGARTLPASSF